MPIEIIAVSAFFYGWIFAFLGFGSTIFKVLFHTYKMPVQLRFLVFGVFGMILATLISIALNFFIPISLIVSLVVMFIGIFLLIIYGRDQFSGINKADIGLLAGISLVVFLTIPVFWSNWFDTGLYHMSAIKWIIESPAPLGLANLHTRFGFNCSWFALSALTEQMVFLFDYSYFILNGILAAFFLSAPAILIRRIVLEKTGKISFSDILLMLSIIPVLKTGTAFISSTSPDFPVLVLVLATIYLVIIVLETSLSESNIPLIMLIFSAYALTVKLSAAILFILIIVILASGMLWRHVKVKNMKDSLKSLYMPCCFIIILLALWVLRGVITSGYLLYPSSIGYMSWISWSVPPGMAEADVMWINGYARLPGADALQSLDNWDWVMPWITRNMGFMKDALTILLAGTVIVVLAIFMRALPKTKRDYALFLVPFTLCIIGLAFWFVQAPDLRFGYGFLYGLALTILCWGLWLFVNKFSIFTKNVGAIAIFLTILIIVFSINMSWFNHTAIATAWTGDFHIPAAPANVSVTSDGIAVYVPVNFMSWNEPLPNTPYFNSGLHMKISNSTGLPYMFWFD